MSKNAPFFTVAIPVFNGSAFIQKAVDSVLAQTFDDWELIVIDNQSTDQTWELLQSLYATHSKIRLLRNATNLGVNRNLARCTSEARGEWVAILAADDAHVSHTLETAHREIGQRPNLVLWVHSEIVFDPAYVRICVIYTDATTLGAKYAATMLYKKGNVFGPLSNFIFKRSGAISHNLNFADGAQTADVRFWIRLLMAQPEANALYWPDALSHVLNHEASASWTYRYDKRGIIDLFDNIRALSDLDWDRATLLYQMARVIWCWFSFRRHMPSGARFLPLSVLGTLARRFVAFGNSESGRARP